MAHRVDKVAAQLREELSAIIARDIHDPRLALLSVVDVDVSPDLRNARVRVSTLGGDEQRQAAMAALEHALGFIRHELASRLRDNLRQIPQVRFVDDRNIEYAVHISQVLSGLHPANQDSGGPGSPDEGSRQDQREPADDA
ncbi:MAG TPA: 30S ribosome-binding factor RbfA [Candidatus Dormibacteraeota bacterium]|jgi:ribosome-binding factor A|nr:30S ribosome-binding factor RbfA [Candidatus Dormibacteraeota bacterium]